MHRCDLLTNKNGRKGINLNTGGTLREESIKKINLWRGIIHKKEEERITKLAINPSQHIVEE
jgi:hypothetical protein